MSSSREGGESPDPERQTGAQLHDTPGSGQGVDDVPNKAESKSQVENLPSNPKGPLDEAVKDKFSKPTT